MTPTDAPVLPSTRKSVPVLFAITIFLSASLLFFVQPLFAKISLPVIGGSPGVWTTAMLFFQSVLILGYLYAHLSTRYLPVRAQVVLHVAFWAAALTFLPPGLPDGWRLDAAGAVAPQTLWLFALGVGVPFALLSSNAPLIQSWYSKSGGPSADDPYFLYGASNLGSLLALLAFPLAAEPLFGAGAIATGFAGGFVVLGLGLALCGWTAFGGAAHPEHGHTASAREAVPARRILWWLSLAFVPSSLMLAVTSKISTDIGAVPIVWVIPLSLYLLTFVLTFTPRFGLNPRWFGHATQLSAVLSILIFVGVGAATPGLRELAVLVVCFFIIALWFHRTLYDARPEAANLTLFYVVMSLGGALGGLFNSIVAPLVFNDLDEGAVTLVVALLLFYTLLLKLTPVMVFRGVAVLSVVGVGLTLITDDRLFADRSFFGLHQVQDIDDVRLYSNGTTIHGAQLLSDFDGARPTPVTYYHPEGPLGQIFRSPVVAEARSVGIVGLGIGSLACYARPGQDWHFYEIDAVVDRVARDPTLFTFLSTCTPDAPTHLGDARIVLQEQQDMLFDVLVIDAYSSDAVPVHLTTLEAVELYMDRLTENGVLVFHISNRYYDIDRPLARAAEALNLVIREREQTRMPDGVVGLTLSRVAMLARTDADFRALAADPEWRRIASDGGEAWTDDHANALSILKPWSQISK